MGLSFIENKTYGFFHGLFKYFFFSLRRCHFSYGMLVDEDKKKKKKKKKTTYLESE